MTARRDAATVLAMCAWVKKRISKIEEHAKLVADVSFPDEKTAADVDGTVVAYTSRLTRRPSPPFEYSDEPAFVKWVAERWPTEIEDSVRKSFIDYHLVPLAVGTGGHLVDDQGEVCPFAKLKEPIEYTSTRLTKDADGVLEPLLTGESLTSLPDFIGEPA